MKKTLTLTLIAFFATAAIFTSCGKYEEGPGISLRSKKARVAGDWEIEKMLVDGEEQSTEYFEGLVITYEKDGTGEYDFDGETIELEWEFGDSKESIKTRSKFDGEWSEWEEQDILRLTEKEFWVTYEEDGDESETHLKKKE